MATTTVAQPVPTVVTAGLAPFSVPGAGAVDLVVGSGSCVTVAPAGGVNSKELAAGVANVTSVNPRLTAGSVRCVE